MKCNMMEKEKQVPAFSPPSFPRGNDGCDKLFQTAFRLARRRARMDSRGSVLVEFAILAPVFLMIIFGILELGIVMMAQVLLDGAVIDASRGGMTGYVAENLTREETILAIVDMHTNFLLDTSQIQITSKSYTNFASFGQPEPFTDQNGNTFYDLGEPFTDVNANAQWDEDMGIAGQGGAGDIVLYEISYDWPMLTPIVGNLLSSTGVLTLRSSMVVRNQKYETN